uniref:Uncharacterized protein n=1 Tax=Arundo donax TaxID=35708 RepID=A0A0A9E8D4_ARUDO
MGHHINLPHKVITASDKMLHNRGDAGAVWQAGPGDTEHETHERRLLLGQPTGLREEAHVYGPALLHRQVPIECAPKSFEESHGFVPNRRGFGGIS